MSLIGLLGEGFRHEAPSHAHTKLLQNWYKCSPRFTIVFDWVFATWKQNSLTIDRSVKKRYYNNYRLTTCKLWQLWQTSSILWKIVCFCGGPFLWRPLGTCPVCPVQNPALIGDSNSLLFTPFLTVTRSMASSLTFHEASTRQNGIPNFNLRFDQWTLPRFSFQVTCRLTRNYQIFNNILAT